MDKRNLPDLTVKQLREIAKGLKIKYYYKLTKIDLILAIGDRNITNNVGNNVEYESTNTQKNVALNKNKNTNTKKNLSSSSNNNNISVASGSSSSSNNNDNVF